jgi:hypothetical protein
VFSEWLISASLGLDVMTMSTMPETKIQDLPPGVFRYCFDQCAFIDKVSVAVTGTRRRKTNARLIETTANRPIGGPGKFFYGRAMVGTLSATENPFQLRYGKLNRLPHIADAVLTLRSERRPITAAELYKCATGLFRSGARLRPNNVELTFDISLYRFEEIRNAVVTKAQPRLIEGASRTTVYYGSPRGPWMLRLYQKAPRIIRIELVLRSSLLSRSGITSPDDVLHLRTLPLYKLVRFLACDSSFLTRATANASKARQRVYKDWPNCRPISLLNAMLSDEPTLRKRVLHASEIQNTVNHMQQNLIW